MGYYTYYSMEARNVKDESEYESLVEALKEAGLFTYDDQWGPFDSSDFDAAKQSAFFRPTDEAKWYDHTYDMVKFSKLFPNITFKLHGEGEERDDNWNKYFHDGKSEECIGKIIYPNPIEIEW